MIDTNDVPMAATARRDLRLSGGGAAMLAGIGDSRTVLAQTAPSPPPITAPGKVEVERRGNVLLIGIDRPQALNRLDVPALIALGKAFYQFEHDDGLRVAVLHGIGPNFCMGLDIPSFTAGQAAGTYPSKDPDILNPLGLRPPVRTKPVVVAVQGGVRGIGQELVLSSDIRVAATDSHFGHLKVTVGVFPAGGDTVRFTREAGWGNAMRYMLTGDEWDAAEAYRLGLVQETTPPGKQLDRAVELVSKIAANAPLGVRATLASARQAIGSEDAALQALGPDLQRLLQSEDAKEAQSALREGRKPVFQGR
jgi:enoyl-CoA hydratase/carnithine racemase